MKYTSLFVYLVCFGVLWLAIGPVPTIAIAVMLEVA